MGCLKFAVGPPIVKWFDLRSSFFFLSRTERIFAALPLCAKLRLDSERYHVLKIVLLGFNEGLRFLVVSKVEVMRLDICNEVFVGRLHALTDKLRILSLIHCDEAEIVPSSQLD